jgi:PAS domain S-box-containing protein
VLEPQTQKSRTHRWFHVKAYPAADGGVSVFFEDITSRKSAEEHLRESEERFRAIVDTTPECVKLVAPDGTLLHMNSAGLAMVGAGSGEQVIGRSVYDLIAPEFRDAFRAFNEAVCRGERASLEFDITGLKGERRHLESHAAPMRNTDGRIVQLSITRDVTERKGAERAGLLLGAIVDSSDDAIISKNLSGIITSWNKGAQRLFGYTAEETIGKSITILIPPDRLSEEPEILRRLQRGERVDHFETIRRRKDGTLLDISLTISPVRDRRGKVIGASKIARDITDRKRAEAAIHELNTELSADLVAMTRMQQLSTRLVEAEDFPVLLHDIVDAAVEITRADMGNIQLFEDGVLKIVAQRGFEQPFLDFFNTVHHGEAACGTALERAKRVIVEDVANSPLFEGTPALGAMLAAGARAVQSTPVISRSGRLLGIFSTHYRTPRRSGERELRVLDVLVRQTADLIERKRAEAALLESESRFRQLADSMPQIVWTSRPDGYLDYYNKRWYEFTGFDRDLFGDASWQPILHPDDVQRCTGDWHNAVRTGEPYRVECRFWDRHERRWRWFMGRALAVRDAAGNVVKWFGTCTDIDDQKRVEDELRRVNQDLEQFAYSASHDLQEPLRGVKIYTELLTKRYGDKLDGQAQEFLNYVAGNASRMEMLIRDLLAYTQVTKLEARDQPVDANEALAEVLTNLQGAIRENGAQVTADPLPQIAVHDTHLKQLFQNLIGNAIKYRRQERSPAVQVSAARQNGHWVFCVSDNGIGIEPQYRERIFGLFKRLHSGEKYAGTGIGLAICQRIVERYHGRIWVESEPGQGSAFLFTLPG